MLESSFEIGAEIFFGLVKKTYFSTEKPSF
jgi:hypothetical protein